KDELHAAESGWTQHARVAGQLLIEAKKQVPRGHWLPWLRAECEITSVRTAQAYMQLARLSDADADRVAPLALRDAMRAIAKTKPKTTAAELTDTYQVLVTCQDEHQQAILLDRLTKEGLQCRALMS